MSLKTFIKANAGRDDPVGDICAEIVRNPPERWTLGGIKAKMAATGLIADWAHEALGIAWAEYNRTGTYYHSSMAYRAAG